MAERGRFIVIDGPDGCGKSTQVRALCRFLRKVGQTVRVVRDPGTTPVGLVLRRILLARQAKGPTPTAELLLYLASRAQLAEEVIAPALRRGEWIVSDRYSSSTVAYQGYGAGRARTRGDSWVSLVRDLCRVAEGGMEPDLVVLLDMPPEAGMARIRRPRDRMERRSLAFHRRVREGFLAEAGRDARFAVLDAREPPSHVALRIQALAATCLPPLAARR